jgi:hypothetical protein
MQVRHDGQRRNARGLATLLVLATASPSFAQAEQQWRTV